MLFQEGSGLVIPEPIYVRRLENVSQVQHMESMREKHWSYYLVTDSKMQNSF
jgi:hypothetical protein